MNDNKTKKQQGVSPDSPLKPDPETLHTTDPQEEMKGPISSLMQGIKEKAADKGGEHGDGEEEEGSKEVKKQGEDNWK